MSLSLLRSLSDGLPWLFRKERVSQELDEEVNGFLNGAPRGLKNFA